MMFFRFINDSPKSKFSTVLNPECSKFFEKIVSTIDLSISTNSSHQISNDVPKLTVEIGPDSINYFDFVKNGVKIEKGETKDVEEVIEARLVKLNPQKDNDSWFSIDNEEYEVKPIKITLLPKLVNVFCRNSVGV